MITKVLEKATQREPLDPELKSYLTDHGYYGRTAKCLHWKLVGVERPGWIQVFEFQIRAKKTSGQWEEKFGVCRTDERDGTYEIQLFDDEATLRAATIERTQGMLTVGRGSDHWVKTMLMALFVIAISIATVAAVISFVVGDRAAVMQSE